MRALSISISLAVLAAGPATAGSWSTYRNDRQGLRLSYPSELFALEQTSDAGDGALFKANDSEAKLLIGVRPNDGAHTPRSYRDLLARQSYGTFKIDYEKRGKTWLALSGENESTIFYEKVFFACSATRIASFAIAYPRDQKGRFDTIVERMEDSFQVRNEGCENPEAAQIQPTPSTKPSRDAAPKYTQNFQGKARGRGPYSALANRLARSRGRDVVVVLRRNNPPYDYKIVRGYR